MVFTHRPSVRLDISLVRGVWVVTIFNGDQTEHRSFLNENDARDYGKTRVSNCLGTKDKSGLIKNHSAPVLGPALDGGPRMPLCG